MVIKAVLLILALGLGTVAYVYYNPDSAKTLGQNTLKKVAEKALEQKDLQPFLVELYDKKPLVENNYVQDLPFQKSGNQEYTVLGRPQKIVEFYCQNNNDCVQYYNDPLAMCEIYSGICYANVT